MSRLPPQFLPEHVPSITGLLATSLSAADPHAMAAASNTLVDCEAVPGFCAQLLRIVPDEAQPQPVRLLAAICVRNVVRRQWSASRTTSIPDADKALLRSHVLQLLALREPPLVAQVVALMGELARVDWPRGWPDLPQQLMHIARDAPLPLCGHGLEALLAVLKALEARAAPAMRRALAQLSREMYLDLCRLWLDGVGACMSEVNTCIAEGAGACSDARLLGPASRLKLLSKIMRVVVRRGFEQLSAQPFSHEFWNASAAIVGDICKRMPMLIGCHDTHAALERACKALVSLSTECQKAAPLRFATYLATQLDAARATAAAAAEARIRGAQLVLQAGVGSDAAEAAAARAAADEPPVSVTLHALLLLVNSISAEEYHPPSADGAPAFAGAVSAAQGGGDASLGEAEAAGLRGVGCEAVARLLEAGAVEALWRGTVVPLMMLGHEDLSLWLTDPEAFAAEQEGMSVGQSRRAAAQGLFLALMDAREAVVRPLLLAAIRESESKPLASMLDVLARDALYEAAGLASYRLYPHLDFAAWLRDVLAPQLCNDERALHARVLRRRVAWLASCWVQCVPEAQQPALCDALRRCVLDADPVVASEGLAALARMLEAPQFDPPVLPPLIPDLVRAIVDAMARFSGADGRLRGMQLLEHVVQRAPEEAAAQAPAVLPCMRAVWAAMAQGPSECMVRACMLQTLTSLVAALGEGSEAAHELLLPALGASVDPQHPSAEYLLEPGLELWCATVHAAPRYVPGLHSLAALLPATAQALPQCCQQLAALLQSYILLGGEHFLRDHGGAALRVLHMLSESEMLEGVVVHLCRTQELLLRCFPAQSVGPLSELLSACWLHVQMYAPSDGRGGSDAAPMQRDPVLLPYLDVLARLAVESAGAMADMAREVARQAGGDASPEHCLLALVHVWLRFLPAVRRSTSAPLRKKQWLLALLALLRAYPGLADSVLAPVVDLCVRLAATAEPPHADTLEPGVGELEDRSSEAARRRAAFAHDPVLRLPLREAVAGALADVARSVGADRVRGALAALEPAVQQQVLPFVA